MGAQSPKAEVLSWGSANMATRHRWWGSDSPEREGAPMAMGRRKGRPCARIVAWKGQAVRVPVFPEPETCDISTPRINAKKNRQSD